MNFAHFSSLNARQALCLIRKNITWMRI